MITAIEALNAAVSKNNSQTFESICKNIESMANYGNKFSYTDRFLTPDEITELLSKGFSVSKSKDSHRIGWEFAADVAETEVTILDPLSFPEPSQLQTMQSTIETMNNEDKEAA